MRVRLLTDFGSTYTKVTAVAAGEAKVLGQAQAFTTVATDITEGFEAALEKLRGQLGPFEIQEQWAASSAAGGLKMVTVGLVPDLTAKAAHLGALSAGARVLKVYSYELTREDLAEIQALQPDMILLTGGTDGGNQTRVWTNAQALTELTLRVPMIYAGNNRLAQKVDRLWRQAGQEAYLCENVMPGFGALNLEQVRRLIRQLFLKRIVQAKGLSKVQSQLARILLPTPAAVYQALDLLSRGLPGEVGLGALLAFDVGGATTDVYSMMKGMPEDPSILFQGLPEPFAKRTVEGDLGVRYSMASLIEAIGQETLLKECELQAQVFEDWCRRLEAEPHLLWQEYAESDALDWALAKGAVREGVRRHGGTLTVEYTPSGPVRIQRGKDLRQADFIIGTGGVIVHSQRPRSILTAALARPEDGPLSLLPTQAKILLDQDYLLSAMGLLSLKHPAAALKIMKNRLKAL